MTLAEILSRKVIEPKWIVRDMLPRGTMVILAGEPGAGKSYLSYTLAYRVASGQTFLGYPTERTRVLYFDEENAEPDFLQYNQWAWAAAGTPPIPDLEQTLQIEHFTLLAGWQERMAATAAAFRPGLIIVDTANAALDIKDENDNAEAARAIRVLRAIRTLAANDTTVLVLKHEKQRDPTQHRTIRGAKVWLAAFDQVLYQSLRRGRPRKDGLRTTVLTPDKLRAFGLRFPVVVTPTFLDSEPKGLHLSGFTVRDGAVKDED